MLDPKSKPSLKDRIYWLGHHIAYTGLALNYVVVCWRSGEPEVYGPVAALYVVLAVLTK